MYSTMANCLQKTTPKPIIRNNNYYDCVMSPKTGSDIISDKPLVHVYTWHNGLMLYNTSQQKQVGHIKLMWVASVAHTTCILMHNAVNYSMLNMPVCE